MYAQNDVNSPFYGRSGKYYYNILYDTKPRTQASGKHPSYHFSGYSAPFDLGLYAKVLQIKNTRYKQGFHFIQSKVSIMSKGIDQIVLNKCPDRFEEFEGYIGKAIKQINELNIDYSNPSEVRRIANYINKQTKHLFDYIYNKY